MGESDGGREARRFEAVLATLPEAADAYEVAGEVAESALDDAMDSRLACQVYLLWACFTDWYELRPDERVEAVVAMRDAARAWPAARESEVSRARYFDYWQFDVMDVTNGVPPGWTMRKQRLSEGLYRVTLTDENGQVVSADGANREDLMDQVVRRVEGENAT